jgi:hypothetical protein
MRLKAATCASGLGPRVGLPNNPPKICCIPHRAGAKPETSTTHVPLLVSATLGATVRPVIMSSKACCIPPAVGQCADGCTLSHVSRSWSHACCSALALDLASLDAVHWLCCCNMVAATPARLLVNCGRMHVWFRGGLRLCRSIFVALHFHDTDIVYGTDNGCLLLCAG